jgi:hypothetical protein
MNEMKTGNYLRIFFTVLLISVIGGCTEYPAYELTNQMYVNENSLSMYVGDEVQLTASPADVNFRWSSDNEAVVTVSQTGKITAVSEGLATITVASDEDETKVDVRVKTFIPLKDINVTSSINLDIFDQIQIWAYPVPEDASEYSFTWRSTDTDIVTVDNSGNVKPVNFGTAEIVVVSGNIERRIAVNITEIYKSIPLGFNGPNEMIMTDNETYWDIQSTGNDPYCYTTTMPTDLRERISVIFVLQYQCDMESNNGQVFYCRPNAAGGVSTQMDLHFDNTGIDPNDESLWHEFRLDLADAVKTFSWGAAGHRLRFDFIQNVTGVRLLVRNAEILYR